MLRGPFLNAIEPNKRVAGPRLALMVILMLVAGGATWIVQAQTTPGNTPVGPDNPTQNTPEGNAPAESGSAAPQPVSPATPNESNPNADIELSDQPLYRVKQLFMFSPVINGIILVLSVLGLLFFFGKPGYPGARGVTYVKWLAIAQVILAIAFLAGLFLYLRRLVTR